MTARAAGPAAPAIRAATRRPPPTRLGTGLKAESSDTNGEALLSRFREPSRAHAYPPGIGACLILPCCALEIGYRLARGTQLELMPDCALLFSEPDQQIHRLNPSGAIVAARLQHEATLGELVSELSSHGLEPEKARAWAIDLLRRLAEASLLDTRVPPDLARVVRSQTLQVAGLNFELGFSSEELFRLLGSAYGPLAGGTATPDHKCHIIDAGDFVLLGRDLIQLAQVVDQSTAAVRLKGAILEDVLNGAGHVAALHGACVARSKGAILLLGPPGTGKTTITLALLKHGFGYGSDDVTLVSRSGGVRTVPLPPAVKEGAWSIVERLGFSLT